MQIRRMSASFGKLQSKSLELKNGLNIIEAPNETGKSTWCAFLLAMFYGINSRERDKAGFIAEKNRYAPWNGSLMEGKLDCCVDGTDLTLTRSTRRQTAPMADFKAVFSGTGTEVPDLNGQTCGEQLLGVTREVYERSAFIRQSSLAISQDAGLERRIAALITSGEEDTSYSETFDALKKQLNRRRHNKTGQLPSLENELEILRRQIAEQKQLDTQLKSAHTQIEELGAREASLLSELKLHQEWELAEKHRALKAARTTAQETEQRAVLLRQQLEEARIPEQETIGRLRGAIVNLETTRRAVEKARAERDEAAKVLLRAEATVNESPFAGQTAENAWASALTVSDSKPWSLGELLPSIFMGLLTIALMLLDLADIIFGLPIAIGALIIPFYKNRKWKQQTAVALKKHNVSSAAELREQAIAYGELLKARDTAQADLEKKSAAADTLYNTLSENEQAILLEIRRFAPTAFDSSAADELLRECARQRKTLAEAEAAAAQARIRCDLMEQQIPALSNINAANDMPAPSRPRVAAEAELTKLRSDLAVARSFADRISGQLTSLGDPTILQAKESELTEQIRQLESEYSAIHLAINALEHANANLQNRFSPALGRRAAEIFSSLTEGRYEGVVLDRTFHLSTEPAGDTLYRDAQLLSAGTLDQLYLATRLAICDMILPAENAAPIILDDALTNFDDTRCAAALRQLKEYAKTRQIILFTCHSRESDFFTEDEEVFVQRLTNPSSQV